MEEMRIKYKYLVGKPERKMGLKGTGCENMNWIYLILDRAWLWVFVSTVMNIRIHESSKCLD
jgi:hypothetical protein